jgi:hypothetical protein
MKQKLLLALLALFTLGWTSASAQLTWTDKTSLITNPSFETDDAISDLTTCGWATNRVTGWTIAPSSSSNAQVGVGNSSSTIQGIGSTFSPSEGDKYFYTRNNWNANTNYSFSQVITRDGDNLKAGLYKVTCKAATYSSDAAFNTLTLGLKEGTGSAVTHDGIVLNVWNTWGVIIYKRADDTNLTIEVNFKPGYDGGSKHYALLMDDFHLEFISEADAFEASSNNTIDFSDIINNAGIYNHSTQSTCPRGWTASKHTTGNGNYTEGANGDTRLEGWSGGNLDIDYNQTITNLPAGKYTVTAFAHERAEVGKTYVYASTEGKDDATGLVNSATDSDITTSELKVSNGTMKIGIRSTANDWVTADNFRISFLGFDIDAVKAEYETAHSNAINARDAAENANIVGTERTTFENVITIYTTDDTQSYSWYVEAKEALESAIAAFTAAKPNYDALVAEIAYAKTIGVDEKTADEFAATNQSTAETVVVNTQNLKVAEYTHIKETYTEDATLGTWTEDFAEDLNGEGYVDNGPTYWNEWGTNTRTANQTVTLPAGEYAISCIARGQVGTFGHMYYKIGTDETTVDFIMKGNRGRGVDTNKEANFSGDGTYTCNNEGFGWEYRYLTFKLTQETEVEIGVSAKFTSQWVSIYAPNLFTTEASVKALRLAEIAEAINNVPTGNMYKDVKSRLDAKVAAANNASANNTKDELTAILNELNDAIAAANASIAEYEEISKYLATSQTNFDGDYSTISTAITNGDYEHEADGIAAVKVLRNTYATASMSDNTDLTALIDNNDFELGNTKYWTVVNSSDTGVRETTNDTYRMSNSHGNYLFNTWWQGTPITQNIGKLPAGAYKLQGVVASDGGTVYITMNDKHEAYVETADNKDKSPIVNTKVGIEFDYVFTLDEEQEVTIGIVGGANGTKGSHKDYQAEGYWFYKADNFRLTYLGVTAPENILDGNHYYLKTNGYSIGRGGDSNTEAVMVSDGIPVMISTDKAGISTIKFKDNEKFMMYNDEMVYTDGTIDPKSTYHKPYWKIIAVSDGYNILNTESGLYLTTTTANRNGSDIMVVTLSETAAIWTLTDATLDVAKADLQNAIDQAPKAATSNVGTTAFQLPTDGVNTYSDALETAQAAHDDGDATLASIAAAKADLEAAIEDYNTLEVNAPADGQLFNVILTYDGWTYDKKAITFIANGRNDQGNYNIQYKEEANKNLAQAFTFTKVEGNNYKMSQIDADGVARYISTGVPYGGNTGQIRTTTNADNALAVEVIPTATEGVWNLRNTAANNYIGSQDAGVFTVNSHIDFKLVETTKPSITINTTAAGWGTTILPFAVASIPEGVKVYSCAAVDGSTLTLTQVKALEANKPYIIEGAWEATLTGDAQGIALNYTEGLLTGTYERIAAPNGSYVLQKHDDKVGFFKVDTSVKQPNVPANRAYLTVSNSSAKAFYFGGDATGISAIEALMNGDAEIYNVSGVKQNTLQKGINIIKTSDGKTHKIMVK